MLTVADLLGLALRVLPGRLRERLNAERNRPGKSKEEADTAGSEGETRGFGKARWPAGNAPLLWRASKGHGTQFWRGGEVSRNTKEAEFSESGEETY